MKLFVSYAHKDREFVERLSSALGRREFKVLVDREDIPRFVRWMERLDHMIRNADWVLFILSPAWQSSWWCYWESRLAKSLGKPSAPIKVCEFGKIPRNLSDLQYFDFSETSDFEGQIEKLSADLRDDPLWSVDQIRYQTQAELWRHQNRPDAICLVAQDLNAAKKWLRKRPPPGAASTLLQREFIYRSTFVNGLLYRSMRGEINRTEPEVGRYAEKFGRLFVLFLRWSIAWAIIGFRFVLIYLKLLWHLPYRMYFFNFEAWIKRSLESIGTNLRLIKKSE